MKLKIKVRYLKRRFRRLNRLWAWLNGYFWLRCPACGEWFGGHEIAKDVIWKNRTVGLTTTMGHSVCWRHDVKKYVDIDEAISTFINGSAR